jgi:hypothetical protein
MAITDTFDLFTDDALTTAHTGELSFTHFTDLSDGAQDTVLYLGSVDAARKIQANSNPGVDNMTITPTNKLAGWATATAYIVGDRIEPTTPNTFVYVCTTAGTSHASVEPTWPTTGIGTSTVSDGTAVWTLLSERHELTEIKLATSNGGLTAATPGAALSLGTVINGGNTNDFAIHIRITNAVNNVADSTGKHSIALDIATLIETVL